MMVIMMVMKELMMITIEAFEQVMHIDNMMIIRL